MAHAIRYEYTAFADYLESEHDGHTWHEYLNGEVYAMSGANELHNAVNAELFTAIYAQLPDECRTFLNFNYFYYFKSVRGH